MEIAGWGEGQHASTGEEPGVSTFSLASSILPLLASPPLSSPRLPWLCLLPHFLVFRGGRRLRKMKERYGLTDVRKAANRINFNQVEEEYIDGDEVRRRHARRGRVREQDCAVRGALNFLGRVFFAFEGPFFSCPAALASFVSLRLPPPDPSIQLPSNPPSLPLETSP